MSASNLPANNDESGLAKAGQNLIEQLLKVGINGFGPFKSAAESAADRQCR